MTTGTLLSSKGLIERWQWEENNVLAAIMLDWDDVHAVATRTPSLDSAGSGQTRVETLLHRFKESGAAYLSIPEITLNRLLEKGELSLVAGQRPDKVYLRARDAALAELVTTELRARLPHINPSRTRAKNPLISFTGDLPTVAEVGLGFNPAHIELAHKADLAPVPRPIGYSWMQPEMIERTLSQTAALGATVIAIQGNLIPGHEFKMETTVEVMQRYRLKYAYFSESRHQKGDWFLAKNLAQEGLVILAHEFEPQELLEEDWNTISDRWAKLAIEAGIRLCSVRFFRTLHAADPLESVAYIQVLAQALGQAGFVTGQAGAINLTAFQPRQDAATLAGAGLSAAGAAGLAAELLPVPDAIKFLGTGAAALVLMGLPFLEQAKARTEHHHHHDHHDHDHEHEHGHVHSPAPATAYAPKGIALTTAVAYPAAVVTGNGAGPITTLTRTLALTMAGATALNATTTDPDYVMGIESYRGYNLDWLLPMGFAACSTLLTSRGKGLKSPWRWLPLAGVVLATLKNLGTGSRSDVLALFDREHPHAHTHHLSAFQRAAGDGKMALSSRPLRKWSLLAPLGAVGAALLKEKGQDDLAAVALTAAAAGEAAVLAGFRNGQRPLLKTLEGRAKGLAIGATLAGIAWGVTWLFNKK